VLKTSLDIILRMMPANTDFTSNGSGFFGTTIQFMLMKVFEPLPQLGPRYLTAHSHIIASASIPSICQVNGNSPSVPADSLRVPDVRGRN